MSPPINWYLLGEAITFYQRCGYRYVEVPWAVSNDVARMTFPGAPIQSDFGALIGSAEQGFLAIPVEADDKLVSCSPCFRKELIHDDLYQPWFMKVELYWEGDHLQEVLDDAFAFFTSIRPSSITIINTNEGRDILCGEIEIGSYGVRSIGDRTWTYGTGLALPRFSVAEDRCPV